MVDYSLIAKESRLKVLDLVFSAQTSHIGSLFSCAEVMAVIMERVDFKKDFFVLSAGWKAAMLYYHLWKKGIITEEELNSYCQPGSKFIGLAEPIIPEIPIAGGSMGLGLPGAVGLAMAKKIKGEEGKVYVLMSDGELQCGTTWESAIIAGKMELDNLVVVCDNNKFQAMGKTADILPVSPKAAFRAGRWFTFVMEGHEPKGMAKFFNQYFAKKYRAKKPVFITAQTVKGKGVSFMENNNLYHYKALSQEEYDKAKLELS